ncbi:MAG: hypothetical protein KGI54_09500 [Pseudomonadota bacterium]|nr:hypothetical protein [Pseudomonadota bacterium]
MSFYMPPWANNLEPSQGNVRQWLDSLYSKFQPIEQARWNQSNIDTLFYAGAQTFVNRYFGITQQSSQQQFYFNLLQQPVNMVTGYQRQHRKQINYIPAEGADTQTTDQYTKLMTHLCNANGIHEQFSRACEQACITGMVLLQPYLDYTKDDPAQGELKVKLWEYNSFLIDPYMRSLDGSDAQFVWCQEYISKQEAEVRFPDKISTVTPMSGTPQRYGSFYFLPENYNMARNDLMVLSYVWYKWRKKKKRLYSATRNQFFDYAGGDDHLDALLYNIPDLEVVEVDVPCWKLAVVLNDQLMFQGENPLGFDGCPFVPVIWNYEPHNNYYDLRVRGLVRTMRDSNYLLNRRIILNHDISEATINAGWIRKSGAIANEDNLKKSGQGWDIIINEGYELTDCQKIMPSAVPESDMALADQLQSLIFSTSGVNLETWSAQDQSQASSLTVMLKQAANLMVLQKYFDQWDLSLKQLGELMLAIIQQNWNPAKVGMLIGEEPTPFFFSRVFAKTQVIVEEGVLTPSQKYQEYQQWLELNQQLGGIIPPSKLAEKAPIQGKKELIEILQQMEQQQSAVEAEATNIQHAFEEAKLKEMMSKAVSNLATARERHSRSDSNVGLFEERLSEVQKNEAMSTKAKMEAITALIEAISKYGEVETSLAASGIESFDYKQDIDVQKDKAEAQQNSAGNEFLSQMMSQVGQMGGGQQQPQQGMEPGMNVPQG